MRQLIATHNSGTGEKPANLLSRLMIPFCRTQNKTLKEQYDAGCRMFDIRAKMYEGQFHMAHGLYVTEKSLYDAIIEINHYKEHCYVLLTYEGKFENMGQYESFIHYAKWLHSLTPKILWGPICVKYVDDDITPDCSVILPQQCEWPHTVQGFLPLDGTTWHTYIPIPWLWKKIYCNKTTFSNDAYTFVDFL